MEGPKNTDSYFSRFRTPVEDDSRERVLVLFGGPRLHGATAAVLGDFLDGKDLAADFIHVNRLNIRGCQGCLYCQHHDGDCRVRDDMQGLYEIIRDSKKILMVFPMFYGSMPGEFKVMIDRFFAKSRIEVVDGKNKYGSTWPKGREIFVLVTHGNSLDVVNEGLIRSIRYACIETNSTLKGWYFTPPTDFYDVRQDKGYVQAMLEAAKDF